MWLTFEATRQGGDQVGVNEDRGEKETKVAAQGNSRKKR